MEKLHLHERIMALSKARRETIEETALALGTSGASVRAYKTNPLLFVKHKDAIKINYVI